MINATFLNRVVVNGASRVSGLVNTRATSLYSSEVYLRVQGHYTDSIGLSLTTLYSETSQVSLGHTATYSDLGRVSLGILAPYEVTTLLGANISSPYTLVGNPVTTRFTGLYAQLGVYGTSIQSNVSVTIGGV